VVVVVVVVGEVVVEVVVVVVVEVVVEVVEVVEVDVEVVVVTPGQSGPDVMQNHSSSILHYRNQHRSVELSK